MKKCLAVIVVLGLMVSMCGAEELYSASAWNLDERIHPDLKEGFAAMQDMNITPETLGEGRKVFASTIETLPSDEAVEVRNEIIGSGLRVRVYKPKTVQEGDKLPGVLWIHGGGHLLGAPEQDEALLIRFVKEAGCIVAAPDYRLTPEHPYPADVEDCYSALVWMTENLPVNKDKVAVGGMSAGGGLTASVVLTARDRKSPAIAFQMPLYPELDCRNITPSSHQVTDHRVWCRDFNIAAWKMYLADVSGDVPAYASPALAEDLSGLPPAYIMVGQLDPFRDETITYAQRMLQAGVPVELHVVPGVFHGFELYIPDAPVSRKAVNEYVNAMVNALK